MKIPAQFKPIAKELRELGYRLEKMKSGHIHIRTREGKFVWAMAGSPSEHRAAHMLRCDLRKKGILL